MGEKENTKRRPKKLIKNNVKILLPLERVYHLATYPNNLKYIIKLNNIIKNVKQYFSSKEICK